MAKKTDVDKWMTRIKTAEAVQQDADQRYGYSRAFKQYRGDYHSTLPTWMAGVPMVPINEVYAYFKTFTPSVYARNPRVSFNPTSAGKAAQVKLLELAVNAYWRELRIKHQIRRVIHDAIGAEGVMKLGYSASFGVAEKRDDDKAGFEVNENIESEDIFATRISWRNFLRDPDSVDGLSDARWVAHRVVKPLEAVQNSSLYTNTKNLTATHTRELMFTSQSGRPKMEREPLVEILEIWDIDNGNVLALSSGSNDELWKPKDWPDEFEGYPFQLLRFNMIDDECYAPNLIASWEPQLWEKIKLRSMQLDHIKRFNRQLWAKEGSVSPEEMAKFEQGLTGAVNFYTGDSIPQPNQYPQIQTDIYAVEGRVDLDKDNISGQPNAVRSAPQKTQSRTLGEIDRLISSFQSRQSEPQDIVEEFSSEVAYKLGALIKQFLPGTKFVRATQRDYQEIKEAFGDRWTGNGFNVSRDDIKDAEYEADVKVGSSLPLDRQGRVEAMTGILKLGPSIGIQPGGRLSQIIGKNMLSDFELVEIEAAYEQEIAQLKAQMAVRRQAQIGRADQAIEQVRALRARGEAELGQNGGGGDGL